MTAALQIAIDGPASAGKSTVAKLVAKQLHYTYCDTGAMYRALTLAAMQKQIDLHDEPAVLAVLAEITISFKPGEPEQQVFVNEQEVTQAIRQPDVTNNVSTVAALGGVRQQLVQHQQKIAAAGGIVMDGRDIGTAVLPNAAVKIFLVASVAERAQRRYAENIRKGIDTPLAVLQQEIEVRDKKDSTRAVSPLTQAKDAVLVDTTALSIEQVVAKIIAITNEKQKDMNK
ncbi:(d)CMP kinase [Loigolactobacillus coryniformis]|jgi:cytidylate kinase|uniref:Cytidylate kinase n=2 Tax=Loigolactobacillus coryniformis subsp. coryniformis TaxID=115541 RepID=J2ZS01_9LACO|nr:(d)CMP kinase [Loigolactobacillus coryniformis]ATO55473.1 cytidylate kinase [Loigolactobacillus coryniformis subsp. coryniformis KCTC 3167 = DSM 20001]EJN55701.1 Cytidylate kinase (CK) [Loigolactobacillus coryniformis subsp. coryniformis CECT 5711]KRK16090.1 cytidylate kinase [Loigolactobacillus coryniformis subsp. coryniformis KCTC 3167 = DSM 20001]OEH90302.1 cytidylate kinase [Loigolactobacillus coryniformis subsp. coryniformis]